MGQGAPPSQVSTLIVHQPGSAHRSEFLRRLHDIGRVDEVICHLLKLSLQVLSQTPPSIIGVFFFRLEVLSSYFLDHMQCF